DKTGTLTEGKPALTALHAVHGDNNRLLKIAASIEHGSAHPLATAVVDYAKKQGIAYAPATALRDLPGLGLQAEIEGQQIFLGNQRWMLQLGIPSTELEKQAMIIQGDGLTISWLATELDGKLQLEGI